VRELLLGYLEKGELPWQQEGWPLPDSGLDRPGVDQHNRFPLIGDLIDIAILEKKPDQVLKWYDRRPQGRTGYLWLDEDAIADAVQVWAPERAVGIWKNKAERLIAQVKPSPYQEAATYLRKAGLVMSKQNNQAQWDQYLGSLRATHARKRRLIEILDGLEEKPIMKKRRRISCFRVNRFQSHFMLFHGLVNEINQFFSHEGYLPYGLTTAGGRISPKTLTIRRGRFTALVFISILPV
jgi:hypothetical protein